MNAGGQEPARPVVTGDTRTDAWQADLPQKGTNEIIVHDLKNKQDFKFSVDGAVHVANMLLHAADCARGRAEPGRPGEMILTRIPNDKRRLLEGGDAAS